MESMNKKKLEKKIVIEMHHPMFTYGEHGGQFSFEQGLYPTGGKIPLPILGLAANLLRKTSGASIEDLSNKKYNELRKRIITLSQYSDKVVFVSGHEPTLHDLHVSGIPQFERVAAASTG